MVGEIAIVGAGAALAGTGAVAYLGNRKTLADAEANDPANFDPNDYKLSLGAKVLLAMLAFIFLLLIVSRISKRSRGE